MKAAKKTALILALASTTLYGWWGLGCNWKNAGRTLWDDGVIGGTATWVHGEVNETLDYYVPWPPVDETE